MRLVLFSSVVTCVMNLCNHMSQGCASRIEFIKVELTVFISIQDNDNLNYLLSNTF